MYVPDYSEYQGIKKHKAEPAPSPLLYILPRGETKIKRQSKYCFAVVFRLWQSEAIHDGEAIFVSVVIFEGKAIFGSEGIFDGEAIFCSEFTRDGSKFE